MVVFQAAGEYSKERIWRDLHRLMAVSGSDTVCAEAGCFGDLFGSSENSQRSAITPPKWCLLEFIRCPQTLISVDFPAVENLSDAWNCIVGNLSRPT